MSEIIQNHELVIENNNKIITYQVFKELSLNYPKCEPRKRYGLESDHSNYVIV